MQGYQALGNPKPGHDINYMGLSGVQQFIVANGQLARSNYFIGALGAGALLTVVAILSMLLNN